MAVAEPVEATVLLRDAVTSMLLHNLKYGNWLNFPHFSLWKTVPRRETANLTI
jgi:hypothetical protein